jgi:hypothetical protein
MIWNVLAWPNVDLRVVQAQSRVLNHFGLEVDYTMDSQAHGAWMNRTMASAENDLVGFFDVDCVPTNREIVDKAVEWARANRSFVGIAQASNHIKPASHIFAAPAFFVMHRDAWQELNRPTFSETPHSDVAENVSYAAENRGLKYRALYPTHYERESRDGIWKLGNYGVYGIGTHFKGGIYHLYQGRFNDNVELFVKRCDEIVKGRFSVIDMKRCTEL